MAKFARLKRCTRCRSPHAATELYCPVCGLPTGAHSSSPQTPAYDVGGALEARAETVGRGTPQRSTQAPAVVLSAETGVGLASSTVAKLARAYTLTWRGSLFLGTGFGITLVLALVESASAFLEILAGALIFWGLVQLFGSASAYRRMHRWLVGFAFAVFAAANILRIVFRLDATDMTPLRLGEIILPAAVHDLFFAAVPLLALFLVAGWPARVLLIAGAATQGFQSVHLVATVPTVLATGVVPIDYFDVLLVTTIGAHLPVAVASIMVAIDTHANRVLTAAEAAAMSSSILAPFAQPDGSLRAVVLRAEPRRVKLYLAVLAVFLALWAVIGAGMAAVWMTRSAPLPFLLIPLAPALLAVWGIVRMVRLKRNLVLEFGPSHLKHRQRNGQTVEIAYRDIQCVEVLRARTVHAASIPIGVLGGALGGVAAEGFLGDGTATVPVRLRVWVLGMERPIVIPTRHFRHSESVWIAGVLVSRGVPPSAITETRTRRLALKVRST